ncbi:MAG: DHHA1 domain-containing protein, partial [Coriobacteriales bacterium]|nr:DHHA1 domain-containing protein [Coriobacteriales bacterium]
ALNAKIDVDRRNQIARNHTATHLLQKALSIVLGDHVKQAGSYVAPDRLRFDFTHFSAMTREEIQEVELIVNKEISNNLPVRTYETSLDTARESGVTALFGEKYGEFVRVVEAGDFSSELCGGTHVGRTSEIGLFIILSQSSIGANTRRIEALTSYEAFKYVRKQVSVLIEACEKLVADPETIGKKIDDFQAQVKELRRGRANSFKNKANDVAKDLLKGAYDIQGTKLVIANIEDAKIPELRSVWDGIKQLQGKDATAVVLFSSDDKKAYMISGANDAAVKNGFSAKDVVSKIAPIIGGSGGGKDGMAQAGGNDPSKIDEAISATKHSYNL